MLINLKKFLSASTEVIGENMKSTLKSSVARTSLEASSPFRILEIIGK